MQAGIAAQILLGVFDVWTRTPAAPGGGRRSAEGAPKPPFYGIQAIDRMTSDGSERAPLVTDDGRWRRVVIQAATSVSFYPAAR